MPVLSAFLGIVIRVYHEDHAPPHIHAEYGGSRCIVAIDTGKILAGRLPARCLRLVEEWRAVHVRELEAAWSAAQTGKMPRRIKPLV
jgi:hypothetical protein